MSELKCVSCGVLLRSARYTFTIEFTNGNNKFFVTSPLCSTCYNTLYKIVYNAVFTHKDMNGYLVSSLWNLKMEEE